MKLGIGSKSPVGQISLDSGFESPGTTMVCSFCEYVKIGQSHTVTLMG